VGRHDTMALVGLGSTCHGVHSSLAAGPSTTHGLGQRKLEHSGHQNSLKTGTPVFYAVLLCAVPARARRLRRAPAVKRASWFGLTGHSGGDADEAALRWWREHPVRGEVLVGWLQHPDILGGGRIDLEAEYQDAGGGVWRSRKMGFEGPFAVRMKSPRSIVLKDNTTELEGHVHGPGVLRGKAQQTGRDGGEFELQALPACYSVWWEQHKAQNETTQDPVTRMMIVGSGMPHGEDGLDENGDQQDPMQVLTDLIMGRVPTVAGDGSRPKQKKTMFLSQIRDFAMCPEDVKKHLDRFVIKQTTAKEMLAVAVCDHFYRAKEDLLNTDSLKLNAKKGTTVSNSRSDTRQGAEPVQKIEDVQEKVGNECKAEEAADSEQQSDLKAPSVQVEQSRIDMDHGENTLHGGQPKNSELPPVLSEQDQNPEPESESGVQQENHGRSRSSSSSSSSNSNSTRTNSSKKNYMKPNILLLGPTGSGKTYLVRTLSDLIGVPFVKADATKFTETGYVGRDAEDVLRDLLRAADGDVELAQFGIVYIDEIDKVCAEGGATGPGNFHRGTQSNFLKLLEDTEVTLTDGPHPFKSSQGTKFSTRNVLFVFSGAFSELDKSLKEEHARDSKAFGFAPKKMEPQNEESSAQLQTLLHKAGTEELVKAGLEPEFVGRIPVRVALGALSEDDLYLILAKAEHGAAEQLIDDFRRYGIQLTFTKEALLAVAHQATKEGTGARSLVTVLEGALRRYKFHLPSLVVKGFTALQVTKEVIETPDVELEKILERFGSSNTDRTPQDAMTL